MEVRSLSGRTSVVFVVGLALGSSSCGSPRNDVPVPIAAPLAPVAPADEPLLTPVNDLDRTVVPRTIAVETTSTPAPEIIVPASTIAQPEAAAPGSGSIASVPSVEPVPPVEPAQPPPDSSPVAGNESGILPKYAQAPDEPLDPQWASATAVFDRLAGDNAAASLTVVRNGEIVVSRGSGRTVGGDDVTGDSPMVVASISKVVVALAIARLAAEGLVDIAAPTPWDDIGLDPHPGWRNVTVRELLDHRGGLSKVPDSWFTGEGTCRDHVPSLLTDPPNQRRGRWYYSNGNYCLLGLLVEQRVGAPLGDALQQVVFDPIGLEGVHTTLDGLRGEDVPYRLPVGRLSRLGGAGTVLVSTADTAMVLARMTPHDAAVLQPPSVFSDQYGFGHTGTVDGARACVWVLEGGATVVSVAIAGDSVGSGGRLCDIVVPAVADDLGIGQGVPKRTH